ncbi:hypothetical protein LTR97_007607 [Elasticomyces elasticus]|uniref:Uncharacterized protein n=1 Tax=Elasticomyces elasticus TaxID=574655 RepID=A0AAN7W9G9_9PEZI|nr:hypothetical protein LTR97_007607 [Elasticomyces elasticus]
MVDGRHSTRRAVKAGRASLVSADASAVATSSQRPSKRAAPKKEDKQPSAAIAESKCKLDIDSEAPAAKQAKTTKAAAKSKARPKKAVVKAGEEPVEEQAPVEQEPKPEPEKPKKAAAKTAKTPKSTRKKAAVKAGADHPEQPVLETPAQPEQPSTSDRGPVEQPKPQAVRPTVETKTEPAITENAPVAKTPDTLSPEDIERARAKVKEELAASRGQHAQYQPKSPTYTATSPGHLVAPPEHTTKSPKYAPTSPKYSTTSLSYPGQGTVSPNGGNGSPKYAPTSPKYPVISPVNSSSYQGQNTVPFTEGAFKNVVQSPKYTPTSPGNAYGSGSPVNEAHSPQYGPTSPKYTATSPGNAYGSGSPPNEAQSPQYGPTSPKYTATSPGNAYGSGAPQHEGNPPQYGPTSPKYSATSPGYPGAALTSGLETSAKQPGVSPTYYPTSPKEPSAPYSGEDPFSVPSSTSSTNGNPPTTYAGDSPDVSGLQPAGIESPNDPGTDVGEDFSSLFGDGTPLAKKEEQVVESKPVPLALPKAAPVMALPGLRFGQPSIVPAETATKKSIDVVDDNGNLLFSTPAKEEAVAFSASAEGSEHRQPSVENSEDEGNGWRAEGSN